MTYSPKIHFLLDSEHQALGDELSRVNTVFVLLRQKNIRSHILLLSTDPSYCDKSIRTESVHVLIAPARAPVSHTHSVALIWPAGSKGTGRAAYLHCHVVWGGKTISLVLVSTAVYDKIRSQYIMGLTLRGCSEI